MAGIKASANMWALLANDDPGDSAAAASGRLDDNGKGPVAVGDKQQANGVIGGGGAAKKDKRARKERNKKPLAAATNSEASTAGGKQHKGPAQVEAEYDSDDDSCRSDYSDDEEDGGSCCRKFLRAVLTMAITAIVINIAVPSGTVGRPT